MGRGRLLSIAAMAFCIGLAAAFGLQQGEQRLDVTTWTRVQYLGGAVGVIGKAENWDNTLTIGPDKIEMVSKGKLLFSIESKSVVAITYAGIRSIKPEDALIPLVQVPAAGLGAAAFSLVTLARSRSKEHVIALEYVRTGGAQAGVLLRLHKGNHKQIFEALRNATGVVEHSEALKR